MPPRISIYELYNLKKKKDEVKKNVFNVILDKCHKKIKLSAESGGTSIFYEIPSYLFGFPLYNINICIDYIHNELKKNKLYVQIMPSPNNHILYISWHQNDILDKNISKYLLE